MSREFVGSWRATGNALEASDARAMVNRPYRRATHPVVIPSDQECYIAPFVRHSVTRRLASNVVAQYS